MREEFDVRGNVDKMFCANLENTIKLREQWIGRFGEEALILSEKKSRELYEKFHR